MTRTSRRLATITQKLGFALWQFQELEGVSAQYFVLLAQARPGMGYAAGMSLVNEAQRKTLGTTIHRPRNANLISDDIVDRFENLLRERNWLVHRSRADSKNAVYDEQAMFRLTERLDQISDNVLSLLKEIGSLTERHVKKYGVSDASIDRMTSEILAQWRQAESP